MPEQRIRIQTPEQTATTLEPIRAALDTKVDPDGARLASVVRPAPLRGIPVANNTYVAGQDTNRTTTGTSRKPHVIAVDCTDIRFVYNNWANNGTSGTPNNNDVDSTGPITIRASIEVGGTIYRVTFGGRTDVTLDGGGWIQSDPIALDLTAGTTIYSRTFMAAGGTWHYNGYSGPSGLGQGGWVTTTDLTAPGSGAVADNSNSILYVPSAIIGTPTTTPTPSVLIVGDSIAHGAGDWAGLVSWQGRSTSAPQLAGGGFIPRALYGKYGYLNAAIPGDTTQSFISAVGHFRRLTWAASASTMICEYGRNDVSGSRTVAQIQADLLTAWRMGASRKLRVFQTTITPRSSSTDFWRTAAGQTTDATNAVRVGVNTWIRAGAPIDPGTKAAVAVGTSGALLAGQAGHPLYGYFEVTDLVETARNSGIFKDAANVRTVTDAVTVAGNSVVTSATGAFTSADLGRLITIAGAGTAGATHSATIQAVNNATNITISLAAVTAVTGATANVYDAYTGDGTHLWPYGAAAASAGVVTTNFI